MRYHGNSKATETPSPASTRTGKKTYWLSDMYSWAIRVGRKI